jgi:CDP-diacylglycerol--serine O-phosphatidyltransferase
MRFTLPNLFTLGSIFCGVSAVFYCIDGFNAATGDPARAAWLIIAAALLDGIDGKVARFSQGTSRFGIELDSLADVISFGVAPMVLVYTLKPFGDLTWVPCLLFLMCGAIRLARFNVITNRRVSELGEGRGYEKEHFLGLPIPVAAIAVSSYIIFCWDRWEELHMQGPFMGLVVLLSLLMVSTVSYQTLPTLAFGSIRSVLKLAVWLAAVVAVVINPQLMSFPMVLLYIFSGIATWLLHAARPDEEEVAVPVEK